MAERCVSCGSFLNESEECEVCGWTLEDGGQKIAEEETVVDENRDKKGEKRTNKKEKTTDKQPSAGKCPSCHSYLNELGECEVCGWAPEELQELDEKKEKALGKLMKSYGISRSKAERIYEAEEEQDDVLVGDEVKPLEVEEEETGEGVFIFGENHDEASGDGRDMASEDVFVDKKEGAEEYESAKSVDTDSAEEDFINLDADRTDKKNADEDAFTAETVDDDEYTEAEIIDDDEYTEAEIIDDDEYTEAEIIDDDSTLAATGVPSDSSNKITPGSLLGLVVFAPGISAYILSISYAFGEGTSNMMGSLFIILSAFVVVAGVNILWPKHGSVEARRETRSIRLVATESKAIAQCDVKKNEEVVTVATTIEDHSEDAPFTAVAIVDEESLPSVTVDEEKPLEKTENTENTPEPMETVAKVEDSFDTGAEVKYEPAEDASDDLDDHLFVDDMLEDIEVLDEEDVVFACPLCQKPVPADANKCPSCNAVFED